MGKPTPGFLDGSHWWVGSRDECAEIVPSPSVDNSGRGQFGGRYCLANIGPEQPGIVVGPKHPDVPLGLNWGFCMPRSCLQNDFVKFVQNVLNETPKSVHPFTHNGSVVNWSYCEKVGEEWQLDTSAWIVMYISGNSVFF